MTRRMSHDFGPFVLGGNVFGWTVQQEEGFAILDRFVALGGTTIDTADTYPSWAPGAQGGESEQLIGAWMADRRNRSQVTIATKVAKWQAQPGLTPANIRAACEGSLQRLQTDHIDLYYAHEDDLAVEQEEYLAAFDGLVKEGKVRALGASNFTPERLTSALAIAEQRGFTAFTVSQDHWNLVEREVEQTLIPVLEEEGLKELPYWSLAKGFLTGKYRPGTHVQSSRAGAAQKYLEDSKNLALLGELDELATKYRVSVAAISLAWLRAQPVVGAPIASARTPQQLEVLFECALVSLTPEEVQRLSAITAPG